MVDTVKIMTTYAMRKAVNNAIDDGMMGKAFEIAIRSYIMNRTVDRVKTAGKTDIRFTFDGERHTCEIKTACGEIEQAEHNQYTIYCADVDINFPAELQAYVFTRDEWITFLNGYNGRGKFLRYDARRNHYHIQSFYVSENKRPKASKTIANYIESVLFEQPTVQEFFDR